MTYRQLLAKHTAECQECQRVARGDSPICTPRIILEEMAKEEK